MINGQSRLRLMAVPLVVAVVLADTIVASASVAAPKVLPVAAARTEVRMGKPVHITVASVGVDISVVDGVYNPDAATWTLNHATAQYALSTPRANDASGNTFIYGHNNRLVFRNMVNIQPGAIVSLRTDNGYTFYYRYRSSVDVTPEKVSALTYNGPARLTIQTCVGQHYELRRMFSFDFIRVDTSSVGER